MPSAVRCYAASARYEQMRRMSTAWTRTDRLRQHRHYAGAPVAVAGPRRLRRQQGMEPWRRRDVFGARWQDEEAALLGAPELAQCRWLALREIRLRHSAKAAATIAKSMLARPLPLWTFLNVNVPKGQPKGFRDGGGPKHSHHRRECWCARSKGRPTSGLMKGRNRWERTTARTYSDRADGYIVGRVGPDSPSCCASADDAYLFGDRRTGARWRYGVSGCGPPASPSIP